MGRLLLALVVMVTTAVSSGGTAAGDPTGHGAVPPAPTIHRVTLVTGDTVELTVAGDGRRAVAVQAAARPSGAPVDFQTVGGRDELYVIPSDAAPFLVGGTLDRALFDVAALVRDGLDDASTDTLPVQVGYSGKGVAALPGATRVVPVPAANLAGMKVKHDRAAEFWRSVTAGGVGKIRLDRKVRVALDQSVPMVGAPAAWAAGLDGTGVTVGVVDTGIDATHPDLAGAVIDSANFTEEPDIRDGVGHGTHVASTIAGTGRASTGRFRGVAPGSKLVVAKVFDTSGFATESQVMAGMEWAATHGAKVVNLSLGSAPTDGTDPVSQLVDDLTARTGALFVVAAGNLGADRSVTSPGAASSALTVGAVDKRDALAAFTSRGPRLGDAAAKPEIVAPGVSITAARAAGTALGTPVDDRYTTASGTSMATPHVAGAAALLAQRHPDWPPGRLKDALVGAARDDGLRWFEQGAGRLDIARMISQPATATAALNLGRLPRTSGPATASVSYTNDSDRPLTLRLTLAVHGWAGTPAPEGAVRLDATTVVVPAHGQAAVGISADPRVGETGAYGGLVTATGPDGLSLRTPLGYYVPTPTGPITVGVLDSAGQPATNWFAAVFNESAGASNDPLGPEPLQFVPLGATAEVPQGTYSVSSTVREASLTSRRWTALSATEVVVTGARTEVRLDARAAVPVGVTTPRPTEQRDRTVALRRHLPGTTLFVEWQFVIGADATWQVYATPAASARRGTVSLQDYWTLSERQLDLRVRGTVLNPVYDASTIGAALAGVRTLPVVWANAGRPEDLAGARGKLALVALGNPGPVADPVSATFQAARTAGANAAGAGAAGIAVYVDVPGALPVAGLATTPVPQLGLGAAEGNALRGLLGGGPVTADLTVLPAPRYMDNVSYFDDNGIPADHVRPVDPRTLVPVDSRYHADRPDVRYAKQWTAFPPVPGSLAQRRTTWTGPAQWTEYLGPVDARVPWQRRTSQSALDAAGRTVGELTLFAENVFRPNEPRRSTEDWFGGPLRNGALTLRPDHPVLVAETTGPAWERHCAFCRGGGNPDRFVPALHWMDTAAGHFVTIWQNGRQYFATTRVRLFRDGREIPADGAGDPLSTFPVFTLPTDRGRYRLTMVDAFPAAQRGGPSLALFRLAPRTETTWEFTSGRPTGPVPAGYGCIAPCAVQPLIQLDLQPNLDLDNTAPAGREHRFMIFAGHRAGADGAAPLVNLNVQYSTDDGATWSLAAVHQAGAGAYLVTINHPLAGSTSGYVSLRTHAWDTAGNWVDQTVQRAYALRG
ncbi:MAG TPA: S8 family peptidase [Actinophytocola sp.]|uniref:S8 family peptidase n=1 Tax=Actinophytocola sp. TaxID=1872138 RepID=UPI002E08767E|nr:S8 family peptidase [Actinophytocola sp.]